MRPHLETYGHERLWVNSAGDWGPSDPLSVPKFRAELMRRGHPASLIERITVHNPSAFLAQSENWKAPP